MGYYKNSNGIECFQPDSDENTLYIETGWCQIDIEEMWDQIRFHFEKPGTIVKMSDFTIRSELIHTRCLGYDLMDWGDHDNFLIIERKKS